MAQIFPIWIYYGGEVYSDELEGCSYRGGHMMQTLGNRDMSLNSLLCDIVEKTGLDPLSIKLKARYPIMVYPNRFYQAIDVNCDQSVQAIIEACYSPGALVHMMQIFIEPSLDIVSQTTVDVPPPTLGSSHGSNIPRNPSTFIDTNPVFQGDLHHDMDSIPEYDHVPSPPVQPPIQVAADRGQISPFSFREMLNAEDPDEVVARIDACCINNDYGDRETEEVEHINFEACGDEGEFADVGVEIDEDAVPVSRQVSFHTATVPEFSSVDWIDGMDFGTLALPEFEDGGDTDFKVNQLFASKVALQRAIQMFCINNNRKFKTVKSTTKLYEVRCIQNTCKWRVRGLVSKRDPGYWKVNVVGEPHNCTNPILNNDHVNINSKFIAAHIVEILREQLSLTPSTIRAIIRTHYQYNVTYKKAWLGKQKAIEMLFGSFKNSYNRLPHLLEAIRKANHGTKVIVATQPINTEEHIFRRAFWAFKPCIEAFKHCRPVISIDGTWLYGKYTGTLLVASAPDANNQIVPLAFGLVPSESNDSWGWFMTCIRQYVTDRPGVCVLSDRHRAITHTMNDPFAGWTDSYHRYCMRHFAANYFKVFKNKAIMNKLKWTAKQTQRKKFDKGMKDIEENIPGSIEWIRRATPEHMWSQIEDGGVRFGSMTTNLSEVFNNVLKGVRSLPVSALAELTYYRINQYFWTRRDQHKARREAGDIFSPVVQALLDKRRQTANRHRVEGFRSEPGKWQVITGMHQVKNQTKGGNKQIVELFENSCKCTCGKPQATHLPCSHVMAACASRNVDYAPYVSPYYTMENLYNTYAPEFNPFQDEPYWDYSCPLIYPDETTKKTKPGRPQSTRRRNEMDVGEASSSRENPNRCSKCHEPGHNKRNCANTVRSSQN